MELKYGKHKETTFRNYQVIWLTVFCLAISVTPGFGQQRPHYTQYIMNNYIINPALTGIENYTDIKLSYRNQWVDFPGAPQTIYASVHAPIGKKDYRTTATSFEVPGTNPRGKAYWEDYTAAEPHHGIGGSVINYKTGYINRLFVTASYAYHMGLSSKLNLSAGFAGGFSSVTLDASKVTLANPFDPTISVAAASMQKLKPELNAGLWLYSDRFFAGLSAQQIIPAKYPLQNTSLNKSSLVPHMFVTAGYRMQASEDISVIPSFMFRYIPSMPIFMDVNVKAQYQDRIWLGANYRIKEGLAAMAGVNISSKFNISYSYDTYFNKQQSYLLPYMQKGSHEIVLGFTLGNKYGDLCPTRVW